MGGGAGVSRAAGVLPVWGYHAWGADVPVWSMH